MAVRRGRKEDDEKRLKKKVGYLVAAFLLVFILASVLIIHFYNSSNYVAKVGGEKITKAEYMMILSQEKQYMTAMFGINEMEAESFWNTKIEGEYAIDIAKKGALEMAWESKIQCIKAREKGISITKEEKDVFLGFIEDSIPDSYRTNTQKNEYFNTLFGITYREFKDVYMDLYLVQKFIENIYEEMEITYDELKEYYEDNRDNLDYVTVRHILIKVEQDAADDEKQDAREKAGEVLEKVKKGEDFAELVLEYSDDEYSWNTDGEYTFARNSDFVDEFKNWAFEHEPGDTGVVDTMHGYHVMELLESKVGFEEVTSEAELGLKEKKFSDMLEEWKNQPEFKLTRNDKVYNEIS